MARRRNDPRPMLDICRLQTARLRAMPRQNLERVWAHILDRRRSTSERSLVYNFVNALLWTKLPINQTTPRQRSNAARKATSIEKKIRALQARRCRR